MKMDKSKSI